MRHPSVVAYARIAACSSRRSVVTASTRAVGYSHGFDVRRQRPEEARAHGRQALLGLCLSYSAYVAEVYRAGIESIHPSQTAAARSLGLTRWQAMRFVVIPQAVRRVIPPLLNDFVALQKDTALVAFVVPVAEAFQQAQIFQQQDFNFTPLLCAAVLFLMITIPLTRLVDYLLAKQQKRRQAGVAL